MLIELRYKQRCHNNKVMSHTIDDFKLPEGAVARLWWRLGLNWRLIFAILLPIALLPLVLMKDDDKIQHGDGEIKDSTVSKPMLTIITFILI